MPALTLEDLNRLTKLALLEPDSSRQELLLSQLNSFFDMVKQMQAVDTNNIEPLHTPLSIAQDFPLRLRDDVVTQPDNVAEREAERDLAQRNAPAVENGFFLVPQVIE